MKNTTGFRLGTAGAGAKGFGILEVLAAVAVVSILLSVGVPNLDRWSRQWDLQGSLHMLETSLLWGRMHAIAANSSVTLIVEADGQGFFWMDPFTGRRYENSIRRLPRHVGIVSAPRRPLRFFQHGNAAPAGSYVLQGSAGAYRVVVNPGGRIRVEKL